MATINIRGASLQLVSATSVTGTTGITAIGNLVVVDSLPGTEAGLRDVTELAHTTQSNLIGKLKRLTGELAYVVHVPDTAAHTDRTGTAGILRLDIPTSASTTTTATQYVQVMMSVGFMGDEPQPGDDETDVRRRVRCAPLAAPTMATAAY
jgi:hypothetical protein